MLFGGKRRLGPDGGTSSRADLVTQKSNSCEPQTKETLAAAELERQTILSNIDLS